MERKYGIAIKVTDAYESALATIHWLTFIDMPIFIRLQYGTYIIILRGRGYASVKQFWRYFFFVWVVLCSITTAAITGRY